MLLTHINVLEKFPNLPQFIREGFPLGSDLPPIPHTDTPPNQKSAIEVPHVIEEWAEAEKSLGRLEGPYSRQEMERRLGGPFRTAPLGVVEKAGSPGKFRIVQNLSAAGGLGYSVNDHLEPLGTEWGTAPTTGDIVSTHHRILSGRPHRRRVLHLEHDCIEGIMARRSHLRRRPSRSDRIEGVARVGQHVHRRQC